MLNNLLQKYLKLLQKSSLKTTEETGDWIRNKTVNRITKVSRNSPQKNSKTITNEYNKKYLKKDIYLQKKDRKLLII